MDSAVEAFLRGVVVRGNLEVELASGKTLKLGDGSGPLAGLRFATQTAQWRLLANPELTFGELYMDGLLTVTRGQLYDAALIIADNVLNETKSTWLKAFRALRRPLWRLKPRNSLRRSQRNVAHHYDIDSRLYELFLDADRQYSCAYFEEPGATLEAAQLAKKRHIAAKLRLEPGQSVLDIGCGWGGLGLYLARHCGVSVTGVTLSREQLAIAQGRARDAALAGQLDFRFQDYRTINESFDRIVSVGMFEHVGRAYFDAYFQLIARALRDDGVALVHTIGNPRTPRETSPWIDKYIFPGGYLPTLSEIMPAVERAGLMVSDIEILRIHYAETLKAWRERFQARRVEAAALYDERFCRMWEFYLAGSEASFRTGDCVVFQLQLCKRAGAVPLTRDYIAQTEDELRKRDTRPRSLRLAGE